MKRPGSVASLNGVEDVRAHNSEMNNAFFTPVPTTGSPTEILAGRFQGLRFFFSILLQCADSFALP